jgi:hypothetical protein
MNCDNGEVKCFQEIAEVEEFVIKSKATMKQEAWAVFSQSFQKALSTADIE